MTATIDGSFADTLAAAERAVLGAALLAPGWLRVLHGEGVLPEHFAQRAHGELYQAIVQIADEGGRPDPVTVAARANWTHGTVSDLIGYAPADGSVRDHARLVLEGHRRRQLHRAAHVLDQAARTGDEQLVHDAEMLITRPGERDRRYFEPDELRDEWLERLTGDPTSEPTIPLPWSPLNEFLAGGLRPGWLVVVAGWPGHGKSVAADQILDHATDHGHTGTLYMLEMLRAERLDRCIARYSGVPYWKLARPDRKNLLDSDEMTAVIDAARDLRWGIVEAGGWTPQEVVRHLRWHRPAVAVVDLVNEFHAPRTEDKEELARYLSQAAKELGVCLVAVAHLNRNRLDSRGTKPRPVPADLFGTAAWEQKADVILFVHRAQDVDDDGRVTELPAGELFLGKARGGVKDGIRGDFDGRRMRWTLSP